MHRTLLLIIISLCLGACSLGHNDYSDYRNISAQGWAYNDTISFSTTFGDSLASGRLSVAVRHDNSYLFRNLWLELTVSHDSITSVRDTINIEFADIYGNWYGKGIGSSLQIEKEIFPHITLHDSSSINLRHIMRIDTLQGIEQVGVFFFADNND